MNILNRLKLELGNQEYFKDEQYTQFLIENDLVATDTYDKSTMQRNLLLTVLDILEAVSNDIDTMRRTTTEFTDVTSAYKALQQRIDKVKDKIASLPEVGEEYIIKKIGGKQEVKAHLENLGFVVGGAVTIINTIGGNVIVNVKESRIAISKEMAQRIMI